MSQFKIQAVVGSSAESECAGSFFGFRWPLPIVVAANRADAFIQIFRLLTQQGHDVTVVHVQGRVNPLNFSSADLAAIHTAGIRVKTGFPKSGFQIEDIVPA
jgi:hypothetical protein